MRPADTSGARWGHRGVRAGEGSHRKVAPQRRVPARPQFTPEPTRKLGNWEAGDSGPVVRFAAFQNSTIPAPRGPMLSMAGEVGTVASL